MRAGVMHKIERQLSNIWRNWLASYRPKSYMAPSAPQTSRCHDARCGKPLSIRGAFSLRERISLPTYVLRAPNFGTKPNWTVVMFRTVESYIGPRSHLQLSPVLYIPACA